MRSLRQSGAARAHAPYALITVALLSGSLAAGILLGGLARPGGGSAAPAAPGLRGDRLPGDLAFAPAPAFRLRDARGGMVDTSALRGRPYALTFLYTHCADVCPALADDVRDALAALRPGSAAAVAVSVDPGGDTRADVQAFAARHRLPPAFRYAIGSRTALAPVWRGYFAAPQGADPRTSSHTAAVWLVDARGRLRALYPGGAPVEPGDVAHDLRVLAREPSS